MSYNLHMLTKMALIIIVILPLVYVVISCSKAVQGAQGLNEGLSMKMYADITGTSF